MWWGMFAGMWDVELEIAVNINLQFISFEKTKCFPTLLFEWFYVASFKFEISTIGVLETSENRKLNLNKFQTGWVGEWFSWVILIQRLQFVFHTLWTY